MLRAFSNVSFRRAVELFSAPALGVDNFGSRKRRLKFVGFVQTATGG